MATVSLAVAAVGLAAYPAQAAVGDTQIAWLEVENGAISRGTGVQLRRPRQLLRHGLLHVPRDRDAVDDDGDRSRCRHLSGVDPLRSRSARRGRERDPLDGSAHQRRLPAGRQLSDDELRRLGGLELRPGRRDPCPGCQHPRGRLRPHATDFCRLNFDAIQVGGPSPDTCASTPVQPGATALFDGTFASFDQWRKAGARGFGHQTDCTIRSFGGQGATWNTTAAVRSLHARCRLAPRRQRRRLERLRRLREPRRDPEHRRSR